MTELGQPPGRFREIARLKLADGHVQEALDTSTARLMGHRLDAWADLPDIEALRERGHEARMRVIDDLDRHVADFSSALVARGGTPYLAHTAEERVAKRELADAIEIYTRMVKQLLAAGSTGA